jgi:hypothetical protein
MGLVASRRVRAVAVRERSRKAGEALLRRVARRGGYDLVRSNYYSPIPDVARLPPSLWTSPAAMPGVDLKIDESLSYLRSIGPYIAEWQPPDAAPSGGLGYFRRNNWYGELDGEVLYAIVRDRKPARVVEVGAGFSTLVITEALAANADEGSGCEHLCFDPNPTAQVGEAASRVKFAAVGGEEIELGVFARLAADDILFIDTTHAVRPAGDVVRLLLEVLPTVAPGVVVHVHDFFRPYEYPLFLFEQGLYWQEHYLLQAFLAFNSDFEVLVANHALLRAHEDDVRSIVPRLSPGLHGSALWLRRR